MTPNEAAQFIADNGPGLASIGITVTAVDGVGDTHIQVEHKTSGTMPLLLGDLAAVLNFMLGLQMGMAVAASNQGEIEERLDGLAAKVAATRRDIDAATDRRQTQVGLIELEQGK